MENQREEMKSIPSYLCGMNEWVGEWEESRVTLKERAQNGFSFPEFSLSSTESRSISSQPDLLRELQLSFLHSFLALPWVSVAAGNPLKLQEKTASISYPPD